MAAFAGFILLSKRGGKARQTGRQARLGERTQDHIETLASLRRPCLSWGAGCCCSFRLESPPGRLATTKNSLF